MYYQKGKLIEKNWFKFSPYGDYLDTNCNHKTSSIKETYLTQVSNYFGKFRKRKFATMPLKRLLKYVRYISDSKSRTNIFKRKLKEFSNG